MPRSTPGSKSPIGAPAASFETAARKSEKYSQIAAKDKPKTIDEISAFMDAGMKEEALALVQSSSRGKEGPCLSGIYDPKTGTLFFGQNFLDTINSSRIAYNKWLEEVADEFIRELEKEYSKKVDAGEIQLPENSDIRRAGHSEIQALDLVVKARKKAGITVDKTIISELYLQNIDLTEAFRTRNTGVILRPRKRCDNCFYLTEGINLVNGTE
jgi:hypothetical protein